MAEAFKTLDAQIDWVFSGRPEGDYFDMEVFGDYRTFPGLTFNINNGRINIWRTLIKNNPLAFIRDVFRLDLSGYDLIINDFEPVTAWAAKIRNRCSVGLSHQMAFQSDVPVAKEDFISRLVLDHFAPVYLPLGLHFSDFNKKILPPIVQRQEEGAALNPKEILVYYPYVEPMEMANWLRHFPDYQFHVFHGCDLPSGYRNIHFYPFSTEHFKQVQKRCAGVISSAGFELPSEAIQLGQKMLLLPIKGHMEQQSNALSLHQLGAATVTNHFCKETLSQWLKQPTKNTKPFPDVASAVAKWLINSKKDSLEDLSKELWQAYRAPSSDKMEQEPIKYAANA